MSGKLRTLDAKEAGYLRSMWLGNWLTFGVLAAGASVLVPGKPALSVMAGALIAMINFRLLQRSVCRAVLQKERARVSRTLGTILFKYYLKLGVTAAVLGLLIHYRLVELFGLLVGLSAVVLSLMVWGVHLACKLGKEPA